MSNMPSASPSSASSSSSSSSSSCQCQGRSSACPCRYVSLDSSLTASVNHNMASLLDRGRVAGDDPYTRTYNPTLSINGMRPQLPAFRGSPFSPAPTYDSGPPSPILEKGFSASNSQESLHDRPDADGAYQEQSEAAQHAAFLDWKRCHGSNAVRMPSSLPAAIANGGIYKRTGHVRKFSEQISLLGEKIAAPVRRRLAPAGYVGSRSAGPGAIGESPFRYTGPLRTQRFRWILRILGAIVTLSFVSALLPATSSLSVWRLLGDDDLLVEYPTGADNRNQHLAAGKGWGWRVKDDWKAGNAKTRPSKLGQIRYDYMYSGQSSAGPSSTAQDVDADVDGHPDIPCHLNVAAFGAQYNLTSTYTYSRRYVTAKHSPPSPDRPDGFDPHPRQLDQPLVQGWNEVHWDGRSGLGRNACAGLTEKRRIMCLSRIAQMDPPANKAELAKMDEQVKVGDPNGKISDDVPLRLTRRSSLTPLSSCSSSQEPLGIPTYPLPHTRTQPHNLILGLASDVERIFNFLPQLEYSFAWSNLHLVLNLPADPKAKALRAKMQAKGIRVTIIQSPEEDYLRRWVELPSLLYDFAEPGVTQWAMVADVDTFWMSISKILTMLDKYDPDRPRYIGALTDDWRQSNSGPIAFGGAGLILSMPLLQELQPHWTECSRLSGPGDHRLAECIYAHSHTRLTLEWSLMQTDLHDDIRGLLESGRDIATMHHWTSWHTGFDPLLIARAAVVCGSECLLQRFLSHGANQTETRSALTTDNESHVFLLVHGLSLTLYPSPHPDFSKTEPTWKVFADSQFAHAIGPTRQRVREGRPSSSHSAVSHPTLSNNWRETWTLEDVRLDIDADGLPFSWDGDGRGAREIYIKRGARAKGYDLGKETVGSEKEERALLSEAEVVSKEKLAAAGLAGLAAKLFGSGSSGSALGDDVVIQEESENDSVIELIWV